MFRKELGCSVLAPFAHQPHGEAARRRLHIYSIDIRLQCQGKEEKSRLEIRTVGSLSSPKFPQIGSKILLTAPL